MGLDVQFPQQRPFPFSPDTRPNRLDVGVGEQVQHLQPIGCLHLFGKVDHDGLIVEVQALSDVRHLQMVRH